MKILYILFVVGFVSISCVDRNVKIATSTDITYVNTLNFRYEHVKQKAILLDGLINDSILVNALFDTGLTQNKIYTTDSLKEFLSKDTVLLQIGSFTNMMQIDYVAKNHFFFQHFGSNTAFIGWSFFKDKIIRISYKNKQIQVIEDLSTLSDQYSKVKIDKSDWNGLFIPITVHIQGKKITEKIIIDTRNNRGIDFGKAIQTKYAINTKNALHVTGQNSQGDNNKYFLMPDSIKIDRHTVPVNKYVGFWINRENPGLLGNEILDQFDIILDLKDFYLYIRPVEHK